MGKMGRVMTSRNAEGAYVSQVEPTDHLGVTATPTMDMITLVTTELPQPFKVGADIVHSKGGD